MVMIVPDLVYDIGMHVGNDTAHYLSEGYRVIGIEANPLLVEHCKQRFAREISSGLLRILHVGVTEKNGVMPFYINSRNSEWSHFTKEIGWRDGQEGTIVEVPTVRFEELIEYYKSPYFIKCDIETSDLHVLNALKSLAPENLPMYVSVEAHDLDYLVILRSLGYEQFKIVDQKAHGMLACSGPFGEKSPGQWVPLDVATYEWLHWKMNHRDRHTWLTNDPGTWHDFHAKRTW
jgi:FkbM family methyltransferase